MTIQDKAAALFSGAVEQARNPLFYERFGVSDTVEGRFELVALHVFLVMRALKGGGRKARLVSEALVEHTFRSMDDAMRELGVGDLSVGRKMRKLAEHFYGRVSVYDASLAKGAAPEAFVEAVSRNIYETFNASDAPTLAAYSRVAAAAVADAELQELLEGRFIFPTPRWEEN